MAVIKCPGCTQENVSDTAESCPVVLYRFMKHIKVALMINTEMY